MFLMRARTSFRRTVLVGAAVAACAAQPGIARADDRAAVQAILTALDASQPGSTDDAIKQTKDALERATRMRVAGDVEHARIADGLALEWARLAWDRARTEATEKAAHASQLAAIEAAARVEREQALLEESITRSGRLRAELAALTTKDAKAKAKDRTSTSAPDAAPKPTGKKPAQVPDKGKAGATAAPTSHVDADAPASQPDHGGAR